MEILEVVFAVFVERRIEPVHEIIVERYHFRTQKFGHQVRCQALGRGGFTTRRWSRYEHNPGTAALKSLRYLGGYRTQHLRVDGFGYVDDFCHAFRLYCLIELAHITHIDNMVDGFALHKGIEYLFVLAGFGGNIGVFRVRTQEQHAIFVGNKVEGVDMTRRGR